MKAFIEDENYKREGMTPEEWKEWWRRLGGLTTGLETEFPKWEEDLLTIDDQVTTQLEDGLVNMKTQLQATPQKADQLNFFISTWSTS